MTIKAPSSVRRMLRAPAPDVAVGAAAGTLWSLTLLGHFGRNSLAVDLALMGSYVLGYSLFWTIASTMVRVLMPSGPSKSPGATIPFILIANLYVFVLFAFYLPTRGMTWHAVVATVLAIGLAVAINRWIATSTPAPRPRWMGATAALLGVVLLAGLVSERLARRGRPEPNETTATTSSTAHRTRVTLLGADGVDWNLLNRLVRDGLLPNTERAMSQGFAAPLQTFSSKSPLIWTSIATGVAPSEHGVLDFVWPYLRGTEVFLPHSRLDFLGKLTARVVPYRDMRPFSSYNRTAPAIWQIASAFGQRVLLVNWWATYPAEVVNGVVVSDYAIPSDVINRAKIEKMSRFHRLAFPEGAQSTVMETMRDFVGGRTFSLSVDPSVPASERNEFFRVRDDLAWEVFRALNEPEFHLRLLFLSAADAPSHVYTHDAIGGNVDEVRPLRVPETTATKLWEELVIDAYLRFDAVVGQLLDEQTESDVLFIVSDHGWRYDGTSHWRQPDGVLIMHGGIVESGRSLPSAQVYDVFPTLCYALGLPISRELEGEILREAFAPAFSRERAPVLMDNYGTISTPGALTSHELDVGHLDRLRSLGYIE